MPFQLKSSGGSTGGKEFYFTKDVVRIGRLPDNDLILYDSGVSRYHCEVITQTDGFLLRDVGSINGTLLNGLLITEAPIHPGDEIGVGAISLRFGEDRPKAKRNPRVGGHAGRRPSDPLSRQRLEDTKTRAMTPEQLDYERALLEARVATEVLPGLSRRGRRLARLYRKQTPGVRVALSIAGVILILAIASSATLWLNQPVQDRSNEVFSLVSQADPRSFGYGGVDIQTLDRVYFRFVYHGGEATLSYEASAVDTAKELQILLNGERVAFVPPSKNYPSHRVPLPPALLRSHDNLIAFDNTLTPASKERWSVRRLSITQEPPGKSKGASVAH